MLEMVNASTIFAAASAYLLWLAFLGVRRSRQHRNARMRDVFFTPPTAREIEAAKRWLRQELAVGA